MSIFRRLFVWFFAANLLTLAVSIAIAHAIFERGANQPPDIRDLLESVQESLDQGKVPELSVMRGQRRRAILMRDGARLGGTGRIPSRFRRHMDDLMEAPAELRLPRGAWLVSRKMKSDQGEVLLVVNQWPPKRSPWMRWLAPTLQVLLGIAAIAVIAWIVSRHLSRPLGQLQVAVRQLAAGHLDSRVTPELARRHDEYGLLAMDFDRMASRIELLVDSRDQLLHDVSHELRAPLARLRFSLELADGASQEKTEEMLRRSDREITRIDHLVGELLELARFERPRQLNDLPRVGLRALIAELIDAERPLAEASGVMIELSGGPAIETRMDSDAIFRAIENLIRNAVRFSPQGGTVSVAAELEQSRSEGQQVRVTVRDAGPGVSPELLPRLFEPFFRAPGQGGNPGHLQASDGYGLGLAIVDRVMRAHGGQAQAQNRHDEPSGTHGLQVSLRWPYISD